MTDDKKTQRVVTRTATDPELLVMGRVERMLRSVKDGDARNRIANWVASRDWSDQPIPYALTDAGQSAGKAAQ